MHRESKSSVGSIVFSLNFSVIISVQYNKVNVVKKKQQQQKAAREMCDVTFP